MKWVDLENLETYLTDNAGELFHDDLETILMSEAKRLEQCVNRRVDEYYSSYSPSVYKRTNTLRNSFRISSSIKFNSRSGEASIQLKFDDYPSSSIFDNQLYNGFQGYQVSSLINYGWSVHSGVKFTRVPHFGWQTGARFFERGIEDWQAGNTYGIQIEIM